MVEIYTISLDNPRMEEISKTPLSREAILVNLKILQDLESLKNSHNYDSVVSVPLLDHLLVKYSIPIEFDL